MEKRRKFTGEFKTLKKDGKRFVHSTSRRSLRNSWALRRILISYAAYYNSVRTHRTLHKDAPIFRPIQRIGIIRSHPILGGLHHHYVRV